MEVLVALVIAFYSTLSFSAAADSYLLDKNSPETLNRLRQLGTLGLCTPSPGFSTLTNLHPPRAILVGRMANIKGQYSLIKKLADWSLKQQSIIPVDVGMTISKEVLEEDSNLKLLTLPPYDRVVHFIDADGANAIWMQDLMEIGTKGGKSDPVVLNLTHPGLGQDDEFANTLGKTCSLENIKEDDIHYASEPDGPSVGGNIEGFPGGIIATSTGIDTGLQSFLEWQSDSRLVNVDLSWLSVGHIDELVSLVPAQNSCAFALLVPSPNLGISLLKKMAATSPLEPQTVRTSPDSRTKNKSCIDHLSAAQFGRALTAGEANECQSFKNLNKVYETKINTAINILVARIERQSACKHVEKILMPIIFRPNLFDKGASDINPNPINSIVLNDTIIIPQQPNDIFRKEIEKRLAVTKLKIQFVDVDSYHFLEGHAHCGTNVVRACQDNLATKVLPIEPNPDSQSEVKSGKNPFRD